MTDQEWSVLLSFLTGGVLVGIVGAWFDQVAGVIRGRN
jgi:hypothetical protein